VLRDEEKLGTVIRLLSEPTVPTDNLTALLTAWMGLEVFAQSTFKDVYEPLAFGGPKDAFASGLSSVHPVDFGRSCMKDKYHIRDKFTVNAPELDVAAANPDLSKGTKERHDAIHQMNIAPKAQPTDEARHLLGKYLGLHLDEEAKERMAGRSELRTFVELEDGAHLLFKREMRISAGPRRRPRVFAFRFVRITKLLCSRPQAFAVSSPP
jgi:hypothetical protein